MSPTNNIPPTSFCLAPKMSFDEIPSRIWVYLSLKVFIIYLFILH